MIKIALKSRKDTVTTSGVNTSSFLVYNTAKRANISPGYYYWYDNKWNNLKNVTKGRTVPIFQGVAGDVYLDLSTKDVYFHNGTIWITKIIKEKHLSFVKFDSASGILTYRSTIKNINVIDLSKVVPGFGKPRCISINVSRETVAYINEKELLVILDLKILGKNKFKKCYLLMGKTFSKLIFCS